MGDKGVDLEYLYSRCSICFDRRNEFCLQKCQDQFCTPCFARYVRELVVSSWGLSVKPIKCPACNDVLCKYEWSKHVDPSTVELYEQYNQPYRAIVRHCHKCDNEIKIAQRPPQELEQREKLFDQVESLLADLVHSKGKQRRDAVASSAIVERFKRDYEEHLNTGNISVHTIYLQVMDEVGKYFHVRVSEGRLHKDLKSIPSHALSKLSLLSQKLVSLEQRQKEWRTLQFLHIANFPLTSCSFCQETVCFACGETPFHQSQTCLEFMRNKVLMSPSEDEKTANIKWKLENSKRCPQCSILINRDEGCNKVECVYCGHSFCWNCEGKFDDGNCSFYRCQLVGSSHTSGNKTEPWKESAQSLDASLAPATQGSLKVELGVPDVYKIQAKLGLPA